jgi:hypothetical protein
MYVCMYGISVCAYVFVYVHVCICVCMYMYVCYVCVLLLYQSGPHAMDVIVHGPTCMYVLCV